ncbi:MAG: hypothetical protein O6934_02990 [SAR324 cluster bacterium]|nr:hypothetical protein [SAR324 cluster bacterium]
MKSTWIGKFLICMTAAQLVLAPLALAQEAGVPPGGKPVMENIFFNVLWGSIFGLILGGAVAVIASEKPTAPEGFSDSATEGATAGGIVGLATGLFLVTSGITFDPNASLIFSRNDRGIEDPFVAQRPPAILYPALPFALETSTSGPLRITGFRATVLDLKF